MCNMTMSNQRTLSPLSPNNKLFGVAAVHNSGSSWLDNSLNLLTNIIGEEYDY